MSAGADGYERNKDRARRLHRPRASRYDWLGGAQRAFPYVTLKAVHPQLMPFVEQRATGSILRNRNEFRKNMDYSILITLLFWGLNVVDATVDAHLKGFNVSDDLSFRVRPALLPGNVPGVTFAFTLGKNNAKTISSPTQF